MNVTIVKHVEDRNTLIYLLLLLFPMMGAFARHWFSAIFILISLTAIYGIIRRNQEESTPLYKEEKIVIAGMLLFFIAYLLPTISHPLDINSMEVEIRYLLFIPIYLIVREMKLSQIWFFIGIVVGTYCIFIYGMYELYFLKGGKNSVNISGAYIHHYYGSIAAVTAYIALSAQYSLEKRLQWVCVVGFFLALVSVILSGSRGSYVMALLGAILWGALRFKTHMVILLIVLLTALAATLYKFSDTVNYQVGRAVDDVAYYFTLNDLSEVGDERRSASTRFTLWELSFSIIRDHPLLGIGRDNFERVAQSHMTYEQQEDPLLKHSHPHNAYLEVLVSKGLAGAIAFIMMFFYPLYLFIRDYRVSPNTALPGLMLMATFLVYSLTEIPFIKGNGTAVYLIFLAVTLSFHLRQSKLQASQ